MDLLVAPLEIFDPNDPSTFKVSTHSGSSESISFSTYTTPSVHADDLWMIAVVDYPNDWISSTYTLSVTETVQAPSIVIGGSKTGSLDEIGELDAITFSGTAGTVVRVAVTALSADFDPMVGVADPMSSSILAADDDGGPGLDSLIQGVEIDSTQRYGILVASPVGDPGSLGSTGSYRIDLSACVNSGLNSDGDSLVDSCDDDDDNDDFDDDEDTDPLDPNSCADVDSDLCDDCSSGEYDPFDDGDDADSDIFCDVGDIDDDNDGCSDGEDPNPFTVSEDLDQDFRGADCDPCPLDPLDDWEGDGYCADADVCPDLYDPNQADTDTDGSGDLCDVCPTDPLDDDLDRDDVCTVTDNCPTVGNPGQEDTGGFVPSVPDGTGDACQCGDVSDDGEVDVLDVVLLQRDIDGLPPGLNAPQKCLIAAGGECDALDVAVMRDALAGLFDGVTDACQQTLQIFSFDSQAGEWLAQAGSYSDEFVVVNEGAGSLRYDTTTSSILYMNSDEGTVDWRCAAIDLDVYTPSLTSFSEDALGLILSSEQPGGSHLPPSWQRWHFPRSGLVAGVWQTIRFDLTHPAGYTAGTGADLSSVQYLGLQAMGSGSKTVYFDNLRVVP